MTLPPFPFVYHVIGLVTWNSLGIKFINTPQRNSKKVTKLTETEKFKLKDILYGLVVPIIVALIVLLFPVLLRPAFDSWFPPPTATSAGSPYAFLTPMFTHGMAMMVLFGVPLILGLIWNKWAGGAAGFLMGTLYYIAFAGYNIQWSVINYGSSLNLWADPSFIGNYILGGILLGYIAGALNNKSYKFKRMIGSGLTAAMTVGVMQFILNITVSFAAWMSRADLFQAFYLVMLPMLILGIVAPIVAKVFTWYGMMPGGHS